MRKERDEKKAELAKLKGNQIDEVTLEMLKEKFNRMQKAEKAVVSAVEEASDDSD